MRIALNRKYVTRGGQVVLIDEYYDPKVHDTKYVWHGTIIESSIRESFTEDGSYYGSSSHHLDLVEEFVEAVNTTPIDQVTFGQLQRGVAKLWAIGRIW